jgi:hypothetical protein
VTYTTIESGMATSSVTTMATAGVENLELMLKPNATLSTANQKSSTNAVSTSVAVTPPNKNGRTPTGASITM